MSQVVAVLPGGAEDLRKICTDERALELLGGKGHAFDAQMEWIPAAVKAFPAEAALAPLERYVEQAMRQRYEAFENGLAGIDVLQTGLKFAELSRAAYPNSGEQDQLRKALADREAWFERWTAILRSFNASGQWDEFLLAARELEVHEQAFSEMLKTRGEALKHSLEQHRKAARDRMREGEFAAAYREYRTASLRQPNDAVLIEEMREAWTEYSRRIAIDQQGKREHLSAGQHDAVERDLYFADQNKQAKNLDEALKNVIHAESVIQRALPPGATAPETLKVLYRKADILGAQSKIGEALSTLDQYDLLAVDEERQQANQLRNQLLYQLDRELKDVKAQIQTAWPAGRFHEVRQLAVNGLRVKEDDADLLYAAGVASIITRNSSESRTLFARYLEASNMMESATDQRARVRRLLLTLRDQKNAATETQGEPNWMSGAKLPESIFYCPYSVALQPKIASIEASNKMHMTFEWQGSQLKSITPSFEKPDQATGEKRITFGYDERVPQVATIGVDQSPPRVPGSNPDAAVAGSAVILLNNPYIDPIAEQRLTGRNIATGIAGNRFFNPFVWEKPYRFRLTYDELGRVAEAQEITEPVGTPGNLIVKFEWNGRQLSAVSAYEGPDEHHRAKIYERTLSYEGGRLMDEEVQSQGRQGRIKYVYKADKLVSASCDKNACLDGRSRQVMFASN